MDKKKKIKIPAPKTRRTWKIKPYTRIHSSGKAYDRHKQRVDDSETIAEALGGLSGKRGPRPQEPPSKERSFKKELSKEGLPKGPEPHEPGPKQPLRSEFRFCPRCGGRLLLKRMGDRSRLICAECEFIFYQNPVPAVAAIIPQGKRIVLVKRGEQPHRDDWCLPAGFLELDESPQECAVRETREETGLDIRVKKLFGVDIGRDDPRARVILIIYLAEIIGGQLLAGDDASDVGLFGPEELPDNIAFATHRRAIARYFGEDHGQDTGP